MGVSDWRSMSLGEWAAVIRAWNNVHGGKDDAVPPSEDEFEAAILAARGVS